MANTCTTARDDPLLCAIEGTGPTGQQLPSTTFKREEDPEKEITLTSHDVDDDEIYNRFSVGRKRGIVAVVSFAALLAREYILYFSSSHDGPEVPSYSCENLQLLPPRRFFLRYPNYLLIWALANPSSSDHSVWESLLVLVTISHLCFSYTVAIYLVVIGVAPLGWSPYSTFCKPSALASGVQTSHTACRLRKMVDNGFTCVPSRYLLPVLLESLSLILS